MCILRNLKKNTQFFKPRIFEFFFINDTIKLLKANTSIWNLNAEQMGEFAQYLATLNIY